MSDGGASTPMWVPPAGVWESVSPSVAVFILALVMWRDGRGSCDPTEEELGALLRRDVSTVRRWGKQAAQTKLVSRERRRRPDNSLGGYRYWLDLEKLGLSLGDRATGAVAPQPVSRAQPSPEATAQPERSPVGNHVDNPEATAQPTVPDERSPPPATAQIARSRARVTREGAGARVLSNPIPPSFAFRDAEQKGLMEAIAASCGVGLCRFDECEGLVESLAIAIDKWLVEGFDPDLDIVPTLKRITAHHRAKPVYDFGVDWISRDIRDHRDARLAREAKRAAKAAEGAKPAAANGRRTGGELDRMLGRGGVADAQALERKIAATRNVIALIERGERPVFYLSRDEQQLDGEWLDDAFARLLAAKRAELNRLLVEAENGGGDGAQG